MQIIPAKTPDFVKTWFPNFIWNINTKKKELYLTFDDGPTPEITDWVLKTLKTYNAKATFFCIGNNIEKHPDIFNRILNGGHSVGNHTFNHLKGWRCNTDEYVEDIKKTQALIRAATSADYASHLKLFRPPYGKFKAKQSKQIQSLGYTIILWDVLSYDWDVTVSKASCLKNVITTAKEGSIVVFHDSVKAFPNLKYALPKVLDNYSKKGFSFKGLQQNRDLLIQIPELSQ
ncbi:polysaccharide deacetylase family protein [Winogradskyella eckloniae]|uniref:polysaccharide deacetylase family protein n=1 Tax=Winogradskyella eckloniae TaxID=1089306 RepID=UPI0015638DD4|nr:polysaccharide deacetylase family protein [Winogradskyella eckloniae]NRD18953.1 polysaccharide deacetylase family protein [Winogradskyella eckloniae]